MWHYVELALCRADVALCRAGMVLYSSSRPGKSQWDLFQARVRELEDQCRSQTERFSLLAQELQAFRLHPGPLDLLTSALGCSALGDHPPPPPHCCCSTPQPCQGSGTKGKGSLSDIDLESSDLGSLYGGKELRLEVNQLSRVTQHVKDTPHES